MSAADGAGPRAVLLNQMTALLYEADPVGLARLGAPDDQYAPEAATIIRRLDSASSEDELHEIVYEEFFLLFGEDAWPL